MIGFVAGLARQTVRHNVTINNLLPGAFATDAQVRHIQGLVEQSGQPFEKLWEERGRANPAGRYGQPEELGALCAYICSMHTGYMTDQNILIDGEAIQAPIDAHARRGRCGIMRPLSKRAATRPLTQGSH